MLLAGCAPAASASLPDGVTVSVLQYRADYGPRRLQIAVSNGTSSELTVTSARFLSGRFARPATWTRDTEVPSGTTRDLPVTLARTECEAGGGSDRVQLTFVLPDGAAGSATVVPQDPFGAIDAIVTQDCVQQRTERIARLTLGPSLRVETLAGEPVALLDLTITPTGEDGEVTVESVDRTILLRPRSGNGWPVGVTADAGSGPRAVTLDILPANCRVHTVAEDKRGTYFPIRVTTPDGAAGLYYLPASTALKDELYRYIAQYCGWS